MTKKEHDNFADIEPFIGVAYPEAVVRHIEKLKADGKELHVEYGNETYHGQEAINLLNGLPTDAPVSELEGSFNEWLKDLGLDRQGT